MSQNPYDLLLERILLGDYPPGTCLIENEIADELGVSRTPVREAFLRLKVEGLVSVIPRGGTFVTQASVFMIREVTEIRLVLEDYLAQLVIERHTLKWFDDFQNWFGTAEAGWDGLTDKDWWRKDAEFHEFLDRGANNSVLSSHLRILRQQAVLFWGQSSHRADSLGRIINDFRKALEAIKSKDAERLSEVLQDHCLDHVKRIQGYLNPETRRLLRTVRSKD